MAVKKVINARVVTTQGWFPENKLMVTFDDGKGERCYYIEPADWSNSTISHLDLDDLIGLEATELYELVRHDITY